MNNIFTDEERLKLLEVEYQILTSKLKEIQQIKVDS